MRNRSSLHTWLLLAGMTVVVYAKDRENRHFLLEALIQPRLQIDFVTPVLDSSEVETDIHRATLGFSSDEAQKLGFRVSVDLAEKTVLNDALVRVAPFEIITLQLGRFKPAFGYDLRKEDADLQLISRSKASRFVKEVSGSTRTVGLQISGYLPLGLHYAVGCFDSPNNRGFPFKFFELFTTQLSCSVFDLLTFHAGLRTEVYQQHQLLQYRTTFFTLGGSSELFKKKWFTEVEWFYGDPALRDYLLHWNENEDFVTLSLRIMTGYRVGFKDQVIAPLMAAEHFDDGFAQAVIITAGFRWDIAESIFLNCTAECTRGYDEEAVRDRRIQVQVSYLFKKQF